MANGSVALVKPWDAQGVAQTPDEAVRLTRQSNANLLKFLNTIFGDVVSLTVPQTVLNKTFGAGTVLSLTDADFTLSDDGNPTRQMQFELSGLTVSTLRILTVPDTSDTLVVLAFAQTLSNKTLNNTNTVTLKDTLFTLQDDGDATKQARLQASAITAGQTRVYTLPDATDTLAVLVLVQTLQNKTLDNTNTATLKDTLFTLQDDGDATKQAQWQLSAITAGQTRVYTLPDTSDTLAVLVLTQTFQNKTLDNTNTVTVKDTLWTIQDDGDATKQAKWQASGITAGQTRVYTLPDSDGTLVLLAFAQTLSNKTLDNTTVLTIKDVNWTVQDDGDVTKQAKFQASGITAGQTRTYTLPDVSGTMGLREPRVVDQADATSFTPNADTTDLMTHTNTQAAGTLTANAPSGTPYNGQRLSWLVKCTNSQTWSFNGIYRGSVGLPLPTTTSGTSLKDRLAWIYDSADAKWDLWREVRGY